MNNKVIIILVILAVLILGGVWYLMSNTNNTNYATTGTENGITQTNQNQTTANGTLYVTLTDATADMTGITAVNMTVDKVEVFSGSAQAWTTLSQSTQTFNLLDLKARGQAALLAQVNVPADTYSQVRLHVAKILVTEYGKVKEAKMPSGELKIMTNVKVNDSSSSVAKFDVMADKSMHKTGSGEFIFAPVVKFDSSSNASVNVDSNNMVTASGGNVDSSVNAGMDVDGSMKADFQLDPKAKLNINAGGVINIQ